MAATGSSHPMSLLSQLILDYPNITFREGDAFVWSPAEQVVTYRAKSIGQRAAAWSLLHETAHALLGHSRYRSDVELVRMEAEAWHKAEVLATDYKAKISPDHIDECMNTYRDWLHARSRCPTCTQIGLQARRHTYKCINCQQAWRVSDHKFKRPYRLSVCQL
jgi:hypothetical protein